MDTGSLNRQIFADDTKARVKSHETRELRLAMKSENEIQTGNVMKVVMKAKFFVCYHVTVLYFLFLQQQQKNVSGLTRG